ncbi:MAG: hypothetical protein IPI91_11530 [Flavobacteriales bacterium]|nr:hypothetical protein [Flavobacteriales bacterium]
MKLIRTLATLCLLFMISNGLVAQNWALINPAYKYNYTAMMARTPSATRSS